MPTIRIQPLGISVTASAGVLLRDTLQNAGVLLDYPCGGKGTCRQCRVSVDPAPAAGKGRLKESEYAGGIRLACQLPVTEDCTVSIPEGRLSGQAWKQGLRDTDIAMAIGGGTMRRLKIPLPAPSLEDQRADWERLQAGLAEHGITAAAPDAPSLEHISRILREGGWVAEALCEEDTFLWLDSGADGRSYGFAVDLGTTTVDIALLDLESGARLSRKAYLNGQVAFGADVISRAQSFHDDRGPVRSAVLRTIDEGAGQILAECGVSAVDVVKTVVVGNPIMIHILNGIDPYELTRVPYVPVTARSLRSSPRYYGWTFQENGYVETLPLISAYVGADTVGMIVALDLEKEKKTSLSIDIGTNGEMVLARGGELLATSTAAGPAFEGAQISCGMRALKGAIYDVTLAADGELTLQVVGSAAPKGLCGTGLIAGIAQLLDHGVIDATGRLVDPAEIPIAALRPRLFSLGSEQAFALAEDRSVYISQSDIRTLQLAKGAVRTGVETLLAVSGVAVEQLDALRLAGNFGAGLDARAAMRIGLIPTMDLARVEVVGNAALRGAIMALLSREYARKAESAARNARFVELGGKPEFQARFMESMLF
ncbi:MAG: ASKHA domain-containing protein [Spirochaetia bacterium]